VFSKLLPVKWCTTCIYIKLAVIISIENKVKTRIRIGKLCSSPPYLAPALDDEDAQTVAVASIFSGCVIKMHGADLP